MTGTRLEGGQYKEEVHGSLRLASASLIEAREIEQVEVEEAIVRNGWIGSLACQP